MSDSLPRPADEPIQPPPPAWGAPPATSPAGGTGPVPADVRGVYYSVGLTILLTIVTLGIWSVFWTYRNTEDLKRHNRDGLGGVLSIVILLIFGVVLMFTIPNEIERMYQRDGQRSPVSTLTGLWFLLPIAGMIIWYVKVQRALNAFWISKGAAH